MSMNDDPARQTRMGGGGGRGGVADKVRRIETEQGGASIATRRGKKRSRSVGNFDGFGVMKRLGNQTLRLAGSWEKKKQNYHYTQDFTREGKVPPGKRQPQR